MSHLTVLSVHTPPEQVPGQVKPHALQLLRSEFRFTQSPLQLVYPVSHVVSQIPLVHVTPPFVTEGHCLPQAPQFDVDVQMFVSHPLDSTPSQLPYPA